MSSIKPLTQFDFYSVLEATRGLSLVYFSAQACASCKHLTLILSEMAVNQTELQIFKVDAHQDQALVAEYDVFQLPALFLFKQGQYHAELQCEARINSIVSAISAAKRQPAEDAP